VSVSRLEGHAGVAAALGLVLVKRSADGGEIDIRTADLREKHRRREGRAAGRKGDAVAEGQWP